MRRAGGATSYAPRGAYSSNSGSWLSCSTATKLLIMFAFAAFTFVMGIAVGVQFFDVHNSGASSERPWSALTRERLTPPRLPPGVVAGQRLRRASTTAGEAEEVAGSGGTGGADAQEQEAAAAAPAVARGTGTGTAGLPEVAGSFSGNSFVQLAGPADALEVSAGAWIYLDSRDRGASIKTIMSNRHGGCAVDADHAGYTFYVNNWESGDRALVLEWRDSSGSGNGCGRLSSERDTIPYDEWVHVSFAIQAAPSAAPGVTTPGKAMLFLNGKLLRTGVAMRKPGDVQERVSLTLGMTPDGQYGWVGRIAQAFVLKGVISPKQLLSTVGLTSVVGWVEMADAAKARLLAQMLLSATTPTLPESVPAAARVSAGQSGLYLTELTGKVAVRGADPAQQQREEQVKPARPRQQAAEAAPAEEELPAVEEEQPPQQQEEQAAAGGGGEAPLSYKDQAVDDHVPKILRRGPIGGTLPDGAFDFTDGGNQWVKTMMRVPKNLAPGSTSDAAHLAAGTFSDDVTLEELAASDRQGRLRAQSVKGAMQYVWDNYKKHAWGFDELKPRSGHGDNNWAGLGMTLIDSLDTLWVMDMKEEFREARDWVSANLNFEKHGGLSVFETTIRALGGLLSAYDLSGDRIFLTKAQELGDKLLPAFNTPTGIPKATITLATGWASNPSWTGGGSILAELGTLQVEFRYLSKATGQPHYGAKAEAVIERMDQIKPADGLYPIYISSDNGQPTTNSVTFGALGDSFYEYLIKVWVQGGRQEAMYRRMYDAAMAGMTAKLLKRSNPSKLAYVADWDGANTHDKMDHLVCFVPGMLALGAFNAAGTPGEATATRDLINAKALAYTCWQMYERQATGIAPEFVEFPGGGDLIAAGRAPFYILRPEAAESLYILHQLTGNPIYREWGWKMFQAIDKYCKTTYGYGAHPDVRDTGRVPDDRMESFFLAETLKYLYMLQSPDHSISLERYVFNTEAHPLSVFDRPGKWDKK